MCIFVVLAPLANLPTHCYTITTEKTAENAEGAEGSGQLSTPILELGPYLFQVSPPFRSAAEEQLSLLRRHRVRVTYFSDLLDRFKLPLEDIAPVAHH